MKWNSERDKIPVSLRLPSALYHSIKLLSEKFGLTVQAIIIVALHKFMTEEIVEKSKIEKKTEGNNT